MRVHAKHPRPTGFTLLEVVIALALLSLVAAASTRTLIAARRVGHELTRWRHAHALAVEGLELARAGMPARLWELDGDWTRRVTVRPGGLPGVEAVDVEVRANTGSGPRVRLSTWVWRP